MDAAPKQARSYDGYSDHDLLVRTVTLLEVATGNIDSLRTDIARLWAEKAQQSDVTLLRASVETLRVHKADDTITKDHEHRLRKLERWGWLAVGGLYILTTILGLALHLAK